jgi:5-methylcytosine-specific restriction endonuclease McrA
MSTNQSIHLLADDEVLARLATLVRDVRRSEVALAAHLAEVDERRLYARTAVPSLFAYCTEVLHFSEPEACLRITVARASRRHPAILAMLEDGRIHLSGIAALAPVLTAENRDVLLAHATHRSKREIEELVAEVAPRPDVPDRIRRLPAPARSPMSHSPTASSGSLPLARSNPGPSGAPTEAASSLPVEPWRTAGRAVAAASTAGASGSPRLDEVAPRARAGIAHEAGGRAVGLAAARATRESGAVMPLGAERYKVQFTASATFRDKLERLQALMDRRRSDVSLASAIEAAVDEKLARIEARCFGRTDKPRRATVPPDTKARSRHIPAAIRRTVWRRDEGRCRFVDQEGRRCSARHALEFHHVHPFGLGGEHRADDLRLYCRTHNGYVAEIDYGRRLMSERSRPRDRGAGPREGQPGTE